MNIKLFGDLPFYVSFNSSDVWANRDVFKLDESGAMIGIAGVPPDYFSESGQLWGMPVYRWDNLSSNDYNWFVKRVQKNLELFDILRLDHFRAFVDFWEVPKGELTAKLGEWKRGPGQQIFDFLKRAFGKLPFVAEDLGEVNQEVFDLRDTLGLPGMKVLQFAFGTDMPVSPHIPHHHDSNFIVYTGTHDNNTTRGWYRTDIDNVTKKHIDAYFGRKINAGNIANEMIRMAYASVATTAIIPMQDLLNLSERSRMNTPSTIAKNWVWRMRDQPDDDVAMFLRELSRIFNR